MERVVIHSGLNGFVLLDQLNQIDPEIITGRKTFRNAPIYLGIEAMAQLGAMHVRMLSDFQKHAFLLGVKHMEITRASESLAGEYRLEGILKSNSDAAFSYALTAEHSGCAREHVKIKGLFLFSVVAYNATFKKERLENHYRKVFQCLRNA